MDEDNPGIENFCRLCLKPSTSPRIPLFENQGAEMFESLTSIKISVDDPAPNISCISCFLSLKNAYKYQQKLIATESYLQEQITSNVKIKESKLIPTESFLDEKTSDLSNSKEEIEPNSGPQFVNCDDTPKNEGESESKIEETPQTFRCSECLDEFSHDSDYRQHIDTHEKRKCLMCPEMISVAELKEHNQTHTSGYCHYCGATLKHSHSLRNHVRQYHSNSKISCQKCKKTFSNKKMLDLHVQREHTGEASFECDQCGRKMFTIVLLKKHIRTKHGRERPFLCDHCGKTFVDKAKFNIHKLRYSNEMLFVCEFCGKGFKYKCNMNLHKKNVHKWTEEENFLCRICKKGFQTKLALSSHLVRVKHKNKQKP